ncbi:cytochrome P450 [Chlamydoabsidia padenii]|nr:cytochrome P450 [Chlamydoabsidia padenii]
MFDFTKTSINSQHQVVMATAAALTAGISVYYLTSKKKTDYDTKGAYKEIPMPGSKLPYVGHLLSLGELPGITVNQWTKELGPLIQLKMGTQTWVIISDPYIAHDIFVTNGAVTSDRPIHTWFEYYSHNGRRGIVCTNPGKRWKQARTVAMKVLAPQRVNELSNVLVKEANHLVNLLVTETARNGQIDPVSYLLSGSLNVILTTCLGKRVTGIDDPLFKEITHFVKTSMKYGGAEGDLSQFLPIFNRFDFLTGKKREFVNFINNYRDPLFARLIKEACEGDADCLIKTVVALKEEYELDDTDVIVLMADLIGAGSDTIQVTLSWMFVILSHHPQVQKRLQAEIDGFVQAHGRLPTFEERDQLPLLISVQKECSRYRVAGAFGIPHKAKEDIVVRDYLIPKGTVLLPNMIGMHMNPDIYPDPETFNPDRFLDNTRTMSSSANGNINQRDMYIFGWGRRICPGIHLAEVEVFLVATRLLTIAMIAPPLDKNGKEIPVDLDAIVNAGAVLAPAPYQLRFVSRTDSPLK